MNKKHDKTKEDWSGLFGRAAGTYGQVGPQTSSHWGRRIVELARIRSGARVLDVATGRGAALFPAAEAVGAGGRVIGVDLAGPMVERTVADVSEHRVNNAGLCQMDAEELGLVDACFDHVLCGLSLQFFPRVHQALGEFSRVLRPGGGLAVSTPAGGSRTEQGDNDLLLRYERRSAGLRRWRKRGEEQRKRNRTLDTPAALAETLRRAGFANVQVIEEEAEVVFTDEAEYWAWLWSTARRTLLESLEPDLLGQYKAERLEQLRELRDQDGIHERHKRPTGLAVKPEN